MKNIFSILLVFITMTTIAQTEKPSQLPYHQIPEAPTDYIAGNILSRMIDGLGYRYYWASEGLTEKDLRYKPSKDGRSTFETLEHIHGLSETIVNAPQSKPNVRGGEKITLTYEQLRKYTLENLKEASRLCSGKSAEEIANFKVLFQRGENTSSFPYWNMINGPIEDALWHAGQLVVLRRAAGNPIHSGVNVFTGKTKE